MFEDVHEDAAERAERAQAPASPDPRSTDPVPPIDREAAAGEQSTAFAEAEDFASHTAAAESLSRPEPEADFRDRWLRTEADLQNFRRRAVRDREESVRMAEDRLLLESIGVLDDLERAIAALTAEQAAEKWAQGVVLTAQHMRDALARHGVTPVPSVGQSFDPSVHEALLEVDAPEGVAPGAVVQEIQRGYRRGERALRAARVVVAKSAES